MADHDSNIYETEGVVNVTYEVDGEGRGWYCYFGEKIGECALSEDLVYDRGFGG